MKAFRHSFATDDDGPKASYFTGTFAQIAQIPQRVRRRASLG